MHGVWFTGQRILTHDPYEMTHSTHQPTACSDFHSLIFTMSQQPIPASSMACRWRMR